MEEQLQRIESKIDLLISSLIGVEKSTLTDEDSIPGGGIKPPKKKKKD